MSFQGMDPEAVDHVATRLVDQARTLELIAQRVDALVQRADDVWGGQDAAEFSGWWYHQHRPATMGAAAAVAELARTARLNVQHQRRISGVAGSEAVPGGGSFSWNVFDPVGSTWGAIKDVEGLVSAGGVFAAGRNVAGRYTDNWRRANRALGDFAKFKRSPILQMLHGSGVVQKLGKAAKFVDGNPLLRKIGPLGLAQDAYERGRNVRRELDKGDELGAATEAGHLAASGLKSFKHPVAYLGGMALETVVINVELAREIDWNQGLPNPLAYDNLTEMYLPAFKDAVTDVFTKKIFQIAL